MSSKLDQSLEDISKSRRQGGRANRRRSGPAKAATAKAPVGGVKKNTKTARAATKGGAIGPTSPVNESKIIVSGLPHDVGENSIKDYFTKTVGPVKRVTVTYNQNGVSRGIASIIFGKPDTAGKAAKELNGTLVDGRPLKVEVVVDATHAPQVPAPKPLSERVTQSKAKPKPATATKNGAAAAGGRGRGRPRKGKNPAQRKKTTEELDAEMDDYFVGSENAPAEAAANGAAQPAANGDETMAEIS